MELVVFRFKYFFLVFRREIFTFFLIIRGLYGFRGRVVWFLVGRR